MATTGHTDAIAPEAGERLELIEDGKGGCSTCFSVRNSGVEGREFTEVDCITVLVPFGG